VPRTCAVKLTLVKLAAPSIDPRRAGRLHGVRRRRHHRARPPPIAGRSPAPRDLQEWRLITAPIAFPVLSRCSNMAQLDISYIV
jgi:hypothetical protein